MPRPIDVKRLVSLLLGSLYSLSRSSSCEAAKREFLLGSEAIELYFVPASELAEFNVTLLESRPTMSDTVDEVVARVASSCLG